MKRVSGAGFDVSGGGSMSATRTSKSCLDATLRRASSDYARYVGTEALFRCQKPAEAQVNDDELAFQIVHQVEELWMKLTAYTLIDIEAALRAQAAAPSLLRRFARVETLLTLMARQLAVLDSMPPSAYTEIRSVLGQGSGQDSPGYRAVVQHARALWPAFRDSRLGGTETSLRNVYGDTEGEVYAIADAMLALDIGLARFRHTHLQLVDRMIGLDSRSLKGLPAAALAEGVDRRLFRELWAARCAGKDTADR